MDVREHAKQIVEKYYGAGLEFYQSGGMKQYFRKKRQEHKFFCIFGGGVLGTTLCNWLKGCGITVDFFCDNSQGKIGTEISGVPLIGFPQLLEMKDDTFVMVSATNKGEGRRYNDEINRQLSGFPHKMPNILKFIAFYTNDYHLTYQECMEGAGRSAGALGDSRSKELFLELLKLKFIDSPEPIDKNPLEKFYQPVQYFNKDYYKHTDNAVVADCGAYNGDSLKEFIRLFGDRFRKYCCFEMDKEAFSELEKYYAQLPDGLKDKIMLYPFGVFSEQRTAFYHALTDTLGSSVCAEGEEQVQLAALDDVLGDGGATMVKMDIEGSELPALLGAKHVIEACRPILAISIYHSTEQFFKVPCYILDQFPWYKLYLGLHTTVTDDTVLYAVNGGL